MNDEIDPASLSAHEIWSTNAEYWDNHMGEGRYFQNSLVGPELLRLLSVKPKQRVLDIACGNGNFSRQLANLGVHVTAIDFAEKFIELAKARTEDYAGQISYHVVDVTNRDQLLELGHGVFDAAVCNMGLMDIPIIEPLLEALTYLLKPYGCFVFSILHPCFNSYGTTKSITEHNQGSELITRYSVIVSSYNSQNAYQGIGVIGQPLPHPMFHRPISDYFNLCFDRGFVLNGISEPVFGQEAKSDRAFSWANFKEIPCVLIARMLLAK